VIIAWKCGHVERCIEAYMVMVVSWSLIMMPRTDRLFTWEMSRHGNGDRVPC